MKEKLKNKELHLELIQKKTSDLEEKDKMRSALAIDRDDAILSVQKLHHKVERLQNALGDQRLKNTELKAELADTNELKVKSSKMKNDSNIFLNSNQILTLEQKKKIDELMETVNKLSEKKEAQRQKIGDIKYKLKHTEDDAEQTSSHFKIQLNALTDDLKSTKKALDEVSIREKQVTPT